MYIYIYNTIVAPYSLLTRRLADSLAGRLAGSPGSKAMMKFPLKTVNITYVIS